MTRGFRVQDSGFGVSRVATQRMAHYQNVLSSVERRLPRSSFRSGLTLVELLITIAILATLAAIFLGVTNAAMESSRSARTKSTISKIHTLLLERWDSYSTRRVELQPDLQDAIAALDPSIRGYVAADARLLATREMMKFEMPDRWSDVTNDPELLGSTPAITRFYRRQFESASQRATAEVVAENQRAECLYMVIMYHTGDGEARTLFSRQDIGDTDGDGAEEFLDGWGRPISFMRWPAGFYLSSDLMTDDLNAGGEEDHDPFDPYQRDKVGTITPSLNPDSVAFRVFQYHIDSMRARHQSSGLSAYRLLPLIYSVGPDGSSGLISRSAEHVTALDPYETPGSDPLLGTPDPDSDGAIDNIHNHLLDGS